MATQTRVVLSPEIKEIADEIRGVIRANSTSEVVALLVSRYGKHFIAWWKSNPHQHELTALPIPQADFTIPQPDVDLSSPIEL